MTSRRMNVLVYSGNGSTVESVRHCLYTLRRLLAPNYAVIPVTGDMIIKEPWTASCALIVFPGGADQGYCKTLNGEGNRRISQYVQRGGAYIGFCAGGYYGSKRCEFEVGDRKMEVVGDRELAFYPGICRGCAFPGFVYHSENGARAAELKVNKDALSVGTIPNLFKSYYNGGGVFVDAPKYKDRGVEILASFTEELAVEPGEGVAAIVYCKVGEGAALLTGPHPEFASVNLDRKADGPDFVNVIDTLSEDEKHRMDFLKACLTKLGLTVNQENAVVPSLSRIHLSSLSPPETSLFLSSLQEAISVGEDGEEYIKDENDSFHLEKPSTWKMAKLDEALEDDSSEGGKKKQGEEADDSAGDRIVDYNKVVKRVIAHEDDIPSSKATPYFNHHAFYSNLKHYQESEKLEEPVFGTHLLYGEVVTSTNTLLEKNTRLLRKIPQGLTFTATVQVAGRGRGSNVWVSPAGSLMFSTVIRHPMEKMQTAPVVFVQYLAAMAIISGVKSYSGSAYADTPIKMKWPNDIYAQEPLSKEKKYVKIGGILVNSHYSSKEYISVVGIGLNTSNAAPTTSLNALLPPNLQPFTAEKLLARILTTFESLYDRFLYTGFDRHFEDTYYKDWLHMDQVVTLEAEGGVRAKIKGITRDYGLLIAEQLGWEDRPTGKVWQLQSDSNSFDFFNGLVKRKI